MVLTNWSAAATLSTWPVPPPSFEVASELRLFDEVRLTAPAKLKSSGVPFAEPIAMLLRTRPSVSSEAMRMQMPLPVPLPEML